MMETQKVIIYFEDKVASTFFQHQNWCTWLTFGPLIDTRLGLVDRTLGSLFNTWRVYGKNQTRRAKQGLENHPSKYYFSQTIFNFSDFIRSCLPKVIYPGKEKELEKNVWLALFVHNCPWLSMIDPVCTLLFLYFLFVVVIFTFVILWLEQTPRSLVPLATLKSKILPIQLALLAPRNAVSSSLSLNSFQLLESVEQVSRRTSERYELIQDKLRGFFKKL